VRETALQKPRSVNKEGRRCSRCQNRAFPATQGEDHGKIGHPPAAHGGPHARAGGCALKETVAPGEKLTPEQASDRACSLWGLPMLEQFIPEELNPVGRTLCWRRGRA